MRIKETILLILNQTGRFGLYTKKMHAYILECNLEQKTEYYWEESYWEAMLHEPGKSQLVMSFV